MLTFIPQKLKYGSGIEIEFSELLVELFGVLS
jgi:hypothetical protein